MELPSTRAATICPRLSGLSRFILTLYLTAHALSTQKEKGRNIIAQIRLHIKMLGGILH